jgi:hypothetical protein
VLVPPPALVREAELLVVVVTVAALAAGREDGQHATTKNHVHISILKE